MANYQPKFLNLSTIPLKIPYSDLSSNVLTHSDYIGPLTGDKFVDFLSKSLQSIMFGKQSNSEESGACLVVVAVQDGVGESAEETDDVETAEPNSE